MLYTEGYKYQLYAPETYETGIRPGSNIRTKYIDLSLTGTLTVRDGYAWDGCSSVAVDTATNQRAGLIHDALYQLLRQGLLPASVRLRADEIFRSICRACGMGRFRAWYYFRGVRRGAGSAAKPKNRRKVLEAP